jgi:factor associated with neutral sphingomyelinase activation
MREKKRAIIAQIKEFGQTPKQLFFKPHPTKLPKISQQKENSKSTKEENCDLSNLKISNWNNLEKLILDFSFKLHKDIITSFSLSKDGNTLYSVSQDSSLKLYSISEKKQLRSITIGELSLSSCQLTPDEKTIIIGSWDNNIYIYSINYGRIIDTIEAHDDAVSCLCFKQDILISGSWDATVKIWKFSYKDNTLDNKPIFDFTDFESEVHCIDIDPQGNNAVVGSADGSITFLDIYRKSIIRTIHSHKHIVNQIQYLPDGRRIISCSGDGFLKIIENTDTEIFSIPLKENLKCFTTNGEILILGSEEGTLRVWDLKSATEKFQLKGNPLEPISTVICSFNKEIIILGSIGTIKVFKCKYIEEK